LAIPCAFAFDRKIAKRLDADGNGTFDFDTAWVYADDQAVLQFEDIDGQASTEVMRLSNRYLYGDIVDMLLSDEKYFTNNGFAINAGSASSTAGQSLWPMADHLGSIRDVVDNNGVVRQHMDYDVFGNRLVDTQYDSSGVATTAGSAQAVDELFGYTGRDWDADTNLQYNRARWYDPALGRWLSQDPISFAAGDANVYRYVGNHSSLLADPEGLNGRPVGEVTFKGNGHHKIPVAVIREHLSWLSKELLEFLDRPNEDGPSNLICPPPGTGHNALLHGTIDGYSGHVSKLVQKEIESFRTELKLPANAPIPADKHETLVRKLIASIDGQPADTFVGGFNAAVGKGGTAEVAAFGKSIDKLGGKIRGFVRGSAKCLAPLGAATSGSGNLVEAGKDIKKMQERGETTTWKDWWDAWWDHEIHDPVFLSPGQINPYHPAFGPDGRGA
jgi:RHS repeat-associated protein